MNQSKLQANLEALREFIQSKGWTIVGEKEIQSGYLGIPASLRNEMVLTIVHKQIAMQLLVV